MLNEIKLTVDDKNLDTLLTILNNLKDGLIEDIETTSTKKTTQYQPKTNRIIKEDESGINDRSGKYMNPTLYKQRLKNK